MSLTKGIITALLTPFKEDGSLDEQALRAHVESLLERGVDGFYVCGSTGEAFLLSPEQRMEILEIVADQTNRRASIIAHIGAIGTDLSVALGRHAVSVPGVDAVSSVPPIYYPYTKEEVLGYYLDIAEQLDFPLIPYNFPKLSGVILTPEIIGRMRENRNIVGIKFTSNNFYDMERIKTCDPELTVYNGFDEMFLSGLSMGADGAIGSTFNYIPEKYIALRRHFEEGDMAEAGKTQTEANTHLEAMFKCSCFMAAQKYMVTLSGIPYGEPRKPFIGLAEEEKRFLEGVSRDLGVI